MSLQPLLSAWNRNETGPKMECAAEPTLSKWRRKILMSKLRKSGLVVLLFAIVLLCASVGTGKAVQLADSPDSGKDRVVQPADVVDIRFLCKLPTGEIVAATDPVAEDQPKLSVFLRSGKEAPVSVTAAAPFPEQQAMKEMAFEDEIIYRLADSVVGMKEGEKREVRLAAQDIPTRSERDYVAQLSRIRKRPKEMKMPLGNYQARTGKTPEVGQAFAYDPAFPGRVQAVTEEEVVIRFPKPGDVIQTPLGPGHVRETEENYEIEIEARKGTLVRAGQMVGRIAGVDDKVITLDFRNPLGGATLICDLTVEKGANEKPIVSATGK